jgi:acetyl-CoA carboxylase biotin carboxyl carrier protein
METYVKESLEMAEEGSRKGKLADSDLAERELRSFARSHLREIASVFKESYATELKVEVDEVSFHFVRKREQPLPTVMPGMICQPIDLEHNLKPIISSYLGILHLNDKKGVPYVKVGSLVKKGQLLGWVETMNIKNEINSNRSGVIVEILEENGKPVEYGQVLFVLEV